MGTTIVRTPLVESVCRTPFVQTPTVQTVVPSDNTTFATVKAYCHKITSNHIRPMPTEILYDLSDFTYITSTYEVESRGNMIYVTLVRDYFGGGAACHGYTKTIGYNTKTDEWREIKSEIH